MNNMNKISSHSKNTTNTNNTTHSNATRTMPAVPVLQKTLRDEYLQLKSAVVQENQTKPNEPNLQQPTLQLSNSPNKPVIQRWINLAITPDDIVKATMDVGRPARTNIGGSQGDHTTPFTVLQSQIRNSIAETNINDAWVNLRDTYQIYQQLPGWPDSTQWVKVDLKGELDTLFAHKGDINNMQLVVTKMLVFRNQIALTAIANGGHGHAEGTHAGALQDAERKLQLGHALVNTQDQVIVTMWKSFDHGRVNQMTSADKKNKTLEQHCITIVDAYPILSGLVGLTPAILLTHYGDQVW